MILTSTFPTPECSGSTLLQKSEQQFQDGLPGTPRSSCFTCGLCHRLYIEPESESSSCKVLWLQMCPTSDAHDEHAMATHSEALSTHLELAAREAPRPVDTVP